MTSTPKKLVRPTKQTRGSLRADFCRSRATLEGSCPAQLVREPQRRQGASDVLNAAVR